MYPRRRVSPQMCNGKRRYASSKEAEETARHRRDESGETDLQVYPCDRCGGWHIGHAKPRRPGRL